MEIVPKALDWVKARTECSVSHMFELLSQTVESDVKSAQTHVHTGAEFTFKSFTPTRFSVTRRYPGVSSAGQGVLFEQGETVIKVSQSSEGGPTLLFEASPSLDAQGTCHLVVAGVRFELWQVSQRALKDLFFS